MKAGDEFEYKGVRFRVKSEKSEFSCDGCSLIFYCKDGRTGCSASSEDRIFAKCKHDHVIFVRI
jgi:hypothetical protein